MNVVIKRMCDVILPSSFIIEIKQQFQPYSFSSLSLKTLTGLFLLLCFQLIYKAQSKEEMAKVTTSADAIDLKRAKWAQQLTNKASSHPPSLEESPFGARSSPFPDK